LTTDSGKSPKIRLYCTEDQEIYQRLFEAIFSQESPVNLVNTPADEDLDNTLAGIKASRPDVLLFGRKHISTSIIHDLNQVKTEFPSLGILLLISSLKHEDLILLRKFIEDTPTRFGFLFKNSLTQSDQFYHNIALIKAGHIVIDPTLTGLIYCAEDSSSPISELTQREIEVLYLVSKGFTNAVIGEQLCIDVKTVRHHINNIYSKLKPGLECGKKHPRVSATNAYLRLTGQIVQIDQLP
jgi:DNA-binding NarL/FixJ family response regulator